MRITRIAAMAVAVFLAAGCHRAPVTESGPLPQRGYLWQLDWNPAVMGALVEADRRMDGVVILGAQIHWTAGGSQIERATIPWQVLGKTGKTFAIALRIDPYPGPFVQDDKAAAAVTMAAKSLIAEAAVNGVKLTELQVDFDCAQSKLAGYRAWVAMLRRAVSPVRLVITTLPSWLRMPEFPALAREADGYVLQVHSVPTVQESGRASLCDPALARKWVAAASRLGIPFSVALPTYRCLAGYAPSGKLLGVIMDSVQPAWPPDTRVLEFGTDADAVAGLVREWKASRPAGIRELIWYRVPVATDRFNWRWPTLSAVMAGRAPDHRMEVVREGDNPADLFLANTGEAEEQTGCTVTVTWKNGTLTASDALPGWTLQVGDHRAVFQAASGFGLRLSPGGRRGIGWLRYDQVTPLRFQVAAVHR